MDKYIKFKELINDYIKNDSYMSDVRITDLEFRKSILNDDSEEYISLYLSVKNKTFSWEKIPYPDVQNIQFIMDKFNKYTLDNYKLIDCEVINKLNYDEIDSYWVVRYIYNETENNNEDIDIEIENNESFIKEEIEEVNTTEDFTLDDNKNSENLYNYIDNKIIEKKNKKKYKKYKLDNDIVEHKKNIFSV
ncbi:Predicted membrane protein [Betaentomopoxvirus amoorei]|uniref:AMV224 n=1 Tax=Amsacta moorei entomopoxvirus TaxID=28321 RepID=Q9EMI2_AMEPV|nr:Predicted membrane protein [Amsacta moorei entomopoxvirus]AAG02930.1 AMV224 [Amsacta moorei entomopoxvirus]